jgi:hypothetical protein
MVLFSWKKPPHFFLAAYIAIAVMGAFSFTAVNTLRSVNFEAKNPMSDKIFASFDNYFIQCQAEESTVITKTGNTRFSPLRMGFQLIASLFGSSNSGAPFSKSPLGLSVKIQHANLKKNILLKLRI